MEKHFIKDEKYGYFRIDPLPTEKELDDFYEKIFYKETGKENVCALTEQLKDSRFFDTKRERVADYCASYFGTNEGRKLLDVGCGFGQAMLYFKSRGFEVSGVDVSKDSIDYVCSIGLDGYHANMESFINGEKYDVVTLFHVFEHVRKPAEIILNIRKNFLKPGGLLVIDVPNEFNDFQIAANEEYDLNSWWIAPPVHINYFTVKSFENVLDQCGYEICQMYADFPMEMFLLMGDVYVTDSAIGKACHAKRKLFEENLIRHGKKDALNEFYAMLAKLGLGRNLLSFSKIK